MQLLGYDEEFNSQRSHLKTTNYQESSLSNSDDYMMKLKSNSRMITTLNQDIAKSPIRFQEYLLSTGLKKRHRYTIFSIFRIRRLFRIVIWSGILKLTIEISKRWDDLGSILQFVQKNALRFFERRISTPTKRY